MLRKKEKRISNKTETPYETDLYRVISLNGSMVTARRGEKTVTRSSSFFKIFKTVGKEKKKQKVERQKENSENPRKLEFDLDDFECEEAPALNQEEENDEDNNGGGEENDEKTTEKEGRMVKTAIEKEKWMREKDLEKQQI